MTYNTSSRWRSFKRTGCTFLSCIGFFKLLIWIFLQQPWSYHQPNVSLPTKNSIYFNFRIISLIPIIFNKNSLIPSIPTVFFFGKKPPPAAEIRVWRRSPGTCSANFFPPCFSGESKKKNTWKPATSSVILLLYKQHIYIYYVYYTEYMLVIDISMQTWIYLTIQIYVGIQSNMTYIWQIKFLNI